jgi:hypothetical protein
MTRILIAAAVLAFPAATPQDTWVIVAMRFDTKGVLYVAEARTRAIVSIETADKPGKAQPVKVADLGDQLVKALGEGELSINAIALHPISHAVYLAASRVRGGSTTLFRVNEKGVLEALAQKNAKTKSAALPKGMTPIDLVVGPKGLIVSSFLQDKSFSARLHAVALPLADASVGTADSELYHKSHEAWETQAPLTAMTTFEKDKKTWIVGSTMCTPVVRVDSGEIADKKKVKTTTIVELGMGNAPLSLAVYTKDKKEMLLVSSEEGTYQVDGSLLTEAAKVNEKAATRNQGEIAEVKVLADWKTVTKFAVLDEKSVVVVRRAAKTTLETLDLP